MESVPSALTLASWTSFEFGQLQVVAGDVCVDFLGGQVVTAVAGDGVAVQLEDDLGGLDLLALDAEGDVGGFVGLAVGNAVDE